jgi:predicted DNA binding protein
MTPGIQVRLAVEGRDVCPVAETTDGGGQVRSVDWSASDDDGRVVEEFDLAGEQDVPEEMSVVFESDQGKRVRFDRIESEPCICDRVETHGLPVTDVNATGGELHMTFYASDVEVVRDVVGDLNDAYDSVRIDRLARTGDGDDSDFVLVDRGQLTDRQREVLSTAMRMGYFARPRESNASEVAAALDISPSTFAEHLAAAQSKVVDSLLEQPT